VLLVPFKKLLDRHSNVTMLDETTQENGLPAVDTKEGNGLHTKTTGLHR